MASVRHYGERMGLSAFRRFFEAEKNSAPAAELNTIYQELQNQFPDLPGARSKADKIEALRVYETGHPTLCELIPSDDNFYGINGAGKLAPYVQWVYVPAVKDASDESIEAKTSALGKLIARTVRTRINFDHEIENLKSETLSRYSDLLEKNQNSLDDLSLSLQARLSEWASPEARLALEWVSDITKSVVVQQPMAGIKTGDASFLGSLSRMGHGLQRSYLLALLQELASSNDESAPNLILAIEEPELYQHPPQARHLADVLEELASEDHQVLITTHSPIFIRGYGFENVRLVSNSAHNISIRHITFEKLFDKLRTVKREAPSNKNLGLIAKIHQALQPGISEMFFTRIPVLVEGLEDVSYITTYMQISGRWREFRRLGCHIIPAHGKDKLVLPVAIAIELDMPHFVIFDADGDTTKPEHLAHQEKDNLALMSLLGCQSNAFPANVCTGKNYTIWPEDMGTSIRNDIPQKNYNTYLESARQAYCHEGGLAKHDLFIAEWLTTAYADGLRSNTLEKLCDDIINYARSA